jgi:hypothetical protein
MAVPRKRRARPRAPAPIRAPEPEAAPEPVPAPAPALLTRAAHEVVPETGAVIARRPGDHWRGRLHLVWRRAGACPACHQPRLILQHMLGDAAICDLHAELAYLYDQCYCVCSYDVLERMTPDAAH